MKYFLKKIDGTNAYALINKETNRLVTLDNGRIFFELEDEKNA